MVGVRDGQQVVVRLRLPRGAVVRVADISHDPSAAGGWRRPGQGVAMVRPEVRVESSVRV
ncbi:hypothetical protein DEO23_13450 [Brachybacterium endophyticum]|uniref:Uncharacterized protein n=1 Tax=Brachybacterium endophyticum TaxID=2182385 RepID=A0A2U2RI52_9MICO|nr:hypothetical protein DEO23_13450 [Brachybacterium endophyticum]